MMILETQVSLNLCYTVKPVYNDHLGDKVSMVVIDRWLIKRRPVYNGQNC